MREESKSEKKRQAQKLLSFGLEISNLSLTKIEKLELPEELYKAILAIKAMSSHGAKRRQQQLIGKLLRQTDDEIIYNRYQQVIADEKNQVTVFHEAEQWRQRLLQGNKCDLGTFISTYQVTDIQLLKNLVKKSLAEKNPQSKAAYTELFRFIKAQLLWSTLFLSIVPKDLNTFWSMKLKHYPVK